MSAVEIIEEIKRLPPEERERVRNFARERLEPGQLPADELAEMTRRFVEATDPIEKERLKRELFQGFYGDSGPDA